VIVASQSDPTGSDEIVWFEGPAAPRPLNMTAPALSPLGLGALALGLLCLAVGRSRH
jgi:hypothetical protein